MRATIYHGSGKCIGRPIFGFGKVENDYGLGFYCTEDLELAREWACFEPQDGFANRYQIELDGLRVLDLDSGDYTVLHWLSLLVSNRRINRMTPVMVRGAEWLQAHFAVDLSEVDVILGHRADDSYFQFARSFLSNAISVQTLSKAMKLGGLGRQFVLKSKESFDRIEVDGWVAAPGDVYYPKRKARDVTARTLYEQMEADELLNPGVFIRDIIAEKMEPGDARLQ